MVHIVMFPYMGQGHFNPFVALAELILRHHPSCPITIVGTPLNVAKLRSMLPPSSPVRLAALPFDPSAHGLPPHAECNSELPYPLRIRLNYGSRTLRPALESLLRGLVSSDVDGNNPLCLIADQFFGWTADVARRLGIFHTLFYTCSAHGIVTYISLWRHLPHTKTGEDEFALPDFPHVRLHRNQLSRVAMNATGSDPWSVFYGEELTLNLAAGGVLVNTMEEMEREGVERLRTMFQGKPVWCIGPVLPSSFLAVDSPWRKEERLGKVARVSSQECSEWLDGHPRGSVLYVSFGSQHNISASQMRQLAMGLEESGASFIWSVRPPVEFSPKEEFRSSEWLTEGFEERMREMNRGLVVRNWAPQLTILSHESTGGFLSHCGWNSLLESFICGVPVIGWPVAAEQFYNSEMVVEEMGAGVELARGNTEEVRKEEVARVVKLVMGDTEKRKEVSRKAGEVKEMLRGAWRKQERGSSMGPSLSSLNDFIETIFTGKQKNKRISKGKKGGKKKTVDPFSKKDWYDVKALSIITVRTVCKTLVSRTQGTKIASEGLKHRVFEINMADLQGCPRKELSHQHLAASFYPQVRGVLSHRKKSEDPQILKYSMELDTTNFKVEQLLKEVEVDYSSIKKSLVDALAAIEETVASIPEHKVDSTLCPKFVGDLGVPADKVEFTFRKPETYQIVGSYAIEAVARPVTNIDVLVHMPKCCFREKDFLDHRYHAKRCLYLSVIARHLKSCKVVQKLQWSTFQNEARKPILVVHLSLDLGAASEFLVRIIPCTTNIFAISKLCLSRNNIRSVDQDSQATPNYNSSILEDMFLERNAAFVKNIFLGWKDLSQALLLLKMWARNRSSIYTHDSSNGFLLSVILAYLTTDLGGARVKLSMKPIQIFRVTLDFLATSKLLDKVLFLPSTPEHDISEEEQRKYKQVFSVTLCDPFGFNLAFRITRSAFLELQDEARWTLNYMDKQNGASFEEIFIVRVDFAAKFDYCIRVYLKDDDGTKASKPCLDKEPWRISEEKVCSLLVEGLTDRAKFVRVVWRNVPPEWSLEDGLKLLGDEPLIVGIMIASSERGFRLKDIGPNPENKEEVIKYKKFWGAKVETRRFLDGTIAESVVWEFREWENHLIIKEIAEHVLSSHLAIPKENIVVACDQLDFCLLNGTRDTISYSGDIRKAFDVLSKRLRSLEDLPLRISSVQLLDSASWRASVFPPEPHPLAYEKDVRLGTRSAIPTCVESMKVMIELEGSGNWPLDSIALEKTKTAFLLKIGESLQRHWRMMCVATKDEVNVLMSGYAFHLRILHERDGSLLKKQGMGTLIHNTTPVDNDLFLQSCHSSMLNGLQGRYPMYGPVVRLAKRWVASHLFSNVLKVEAVELLVAYLFLKPFPFYAPFSRVTGFLRFLRLLSEYDWANTPLMVDVNGDLTSQDEAEINENFNQIRRSIVANAENELSALFLATKYDKKSEAWTKLSPSTTALKRIVAYARSADSYLTDLILQGETGQKVWESLFRTSLKNYDAVILLHEDKLAHPERLLFSSDLNLGMRPLVHGNGSKAFAPCIPLKDLIGSSQEVRKKLMVNFDPGRCLVEDIKQEFPGVFGLWYDALGGDAIGLTWENPSKRRKIEGNGASTGPAELLKSVGDAGKGLVKSIYLPKASKKSLKFPHTHVLEHTHG